MAQLRRSLGLALGPHRGLALARDDLQRDVEPGPLVAGEPDRARAAAAERPQRPVAVEDELDAGERWGGLSHALRRLATRSDCPSQLSFAGAVRLATRVSTYDDESELDFFEEPETLEAPGRQRRRVRPQRKGGPRRPTAAAARGRRLSRGWRGLVALAIAVVVGLVFWVDSCQGQSTHDEYASYMNSMQPIAQSSASALGRRSRTSSARASSRSAELQTKLDHWSQQQQQEYDAAQRLVPPASAPGGAPAGAGHAPAARARAGRSRQHARRRQRLEIQLSTVANRLADQAQLLSASDSSGRDLFRLPATETLEAAGHDAA